MSPGVLHGALYVLHQQHCDVFQAWCLVVFPRLFAYGIASCALETSVHQLLLVVRLLQAGVYVIHFSFGPWFF